MCVRQHTNSFSCRLFYVSLPAAAVRFRRAAPQAPLGQPPDLDLSKATPVPPGTPLSVTVIVNGASSAAACGATSVDLRAENGQQTLDFESPVLQLTHGSAACSLVYSTYMTPTLVAAPGLLYGRIDAADAATAAAVPNGIELALPTAFEEAVSATSWLVHLYGSFLTPDPRVDVRVVVGGWDCALVNATMLTAATPPAGNGGGDVSRLDCMLPPISAGDWPVVVSVAGLGAARPPATSRAASMVLHVPLRIYDPARLAGQNVSSPPQPPTAMPQDCQVRLNCSSQSLCHPHSPTAPPTLTALVA
jgi:hypothetical protein